MIQRYKTSEIFSTFCFRRGLKEVTQTLSLAHDPDTQGDNPDNLVTQNLYTGEIVYEWSVTDGYYKKKGADE